VGKRRERDSGEGSGSDQVREEIDAPNQNFLVQTTESYIEVLHIGLHGPCH